MSRPTATCRRAAPSPPPHAALHHPQNTQPAGDDEDLILAKALQEQEHALSMLAGNGGLAGGGWFTGGGPAAADAEEDLSPLDGEDDAAYAARLQAAEDRANFMALAGLQGPAAAAGVEEDGEEAAPSTAPSTSLDLLAGTDTAALSYEQLNALGDIAGTGPRGADPEAVAALPVEVWGEGEGAGSARSDDPAGGCCVVCQCDYEAGDRLAVLPCKHRYHEGCAREALGARKACPLCGAEVE